MNDIIWIAVWAVIAAGLFFWLWRAGYITKLSNYVKLTREELKKCSWPTWEELKGSTVLVFVTIAILGTFTVAVDLIFLRLFTLFKI